MLPRVFCFSKSRINENGGNEQIQIETKRTEEAIRMEQERGHRLIEQVNKKKGINRNNIIKSYKSARSLMESQVKTQ